MPQWKQLSSPGSFPLPTSVELLTSGDSQFSKADSIPFRITVRDLFCSQESLMIKLEGHLDSPPPPPPWPQWLTQASWKTPVVPLIEELMCALTGGSFKPQSPHLSRRPLVGSLCHSLHREQLSTFLEA